MPIYLLNKTIYFLIIFIISINGFSDVVTHCEMDTTQIIFKGQKEKNLEEICFVKKNDITFLVSKSCEKLSCDLLKRRIKNIKIPENNSNLGSPGFKLCYELGGVPQIFEYTKKNLLHETTDRCFYGKNDFVENSLLIDIWRGKIIL